MYEMGCLSANKVHYFNLSSKAQNCSNYVLKNSTRSESYLCPGKRSLDIFLNIFCWVSNLSGIFLSRICPFKIFQLTLTKEKKKKLNIKIKNYERYETSMIQTIGICFWSFLLTSFGVFKGILPTKRAFVYAFLCPSKMVFNFLKKFLNHFLLLF